MSNDILGNPIKERDTIAFSHSKNAWLLIGIVIRVSENTVLIKVTKSIYNYLIDWEIRKTFDRVVVINEITKKEV